MATRSTRQTAVLHGPKTLDGRLLEAGSSTWMTIFKGAKNADLAKELIVSLLDPVSFTPLAQQSAGQVFPAYKNLWTDELIASDPNFKVYQEIMFNPDVYLRSLASGAAQRPDRRHRCGSRSPPR